VSRLIDREHDGLGVVTNYHKEDDKLVVEHVQDVEPYLERNKRWQNGGNRQREEELTKVASIPNVVVLKWLRQGVNVYDKNDQHKVAALLNSPEYRYLKTTDRRIVLK